MGHTPQYGFRAANPTAPDRVDLVPIPGEVIVLVVVGLAVLLTLRILWIVPGWVRTIRRPETRAIRVVGVGGGGNNAVDRMVSAGIEPSASWTSTPTPRPSVGRIETPSP